MCCVSLTPCAGQEELGVACLAVIAQALLEVQPLRVPSFTFAWLELVSHRCARAAHSSVVGHAGYHGNHAQAYRQSLG